MREFYLRGGPGIELYDTQHADMSRTPVAGDVAFYRRFARRTGGPILELACGTGRVAIPLAEDGFEVTGVDLSPHMLAIARAKSNRVLWKRGSMERFSLRRKFKFILIPFRAFQHLMTLRAQRRCLECARLHLGPGGRFVIDIFDPKLEFCLPERATSPPRLSSVVHPRTGRRWEIAVVDRVNDPLTQILRETWVWT